MTASPNPRPPAALGYRPRLPNGMTDWSRYCLQVVRFFGPGRDDYAVETLPFTDKPQAMAYAKAIGATFTV